MLLLVAVKALACDLLDDCAKETIVDVRVAEVAAGCLLCGGEVIAVLVIAPLGLEELAHADRWRDAVDFPVPQR